jgi:transposase
VKKGAAMKGWLVVHKIKAMNDDGKGMTGRQIAKTLGISRNTVSKYLSMSEVEVQAYMDEKLRESALDGYREYLKYLVGKYPKISAVKARRKLESKGINSGVSDRTWRRLLQELKKTTPAVNSRKYEPVIDMIPGVQCQVDIGELRNVTVGGKFITVYFCVFVLSYSRLMYASLSFRPVNTSRFIMMHDEAFRFFGGVPEECVYDQTRLVAIKEEFREVWFNEEFHRYATACSFGLHVCEGYDPESKGKVEAGVKYVKGDFLYAEEFDSEQDMRDRICSWLNDVANERVHGTTMEVPSVVYNEREKKAMKPYLCPAAFIPEDGEYRKADKTSLISHRGSRYSVPMSYQGKQLRIREEGNKLYVIDPEMSLVIAEHKVSEMKGGIFKNRNHYRNYEESLAEKEEEIGRIAGKYGPSICSVLRSTYPKIYKDQLSGFIKVVSPYRSEQGLSEALCALSRRPALSVTFTRDFLGAFFSRKQIFEVSEKPSAYSLKPYEVIHERLRNG